MRIDVVTPPDSEPVSTSEARAWLLLGSATDFDGRINGMVATAREECESKTNRAFMLQTLQLTLPRFPRLWCAYAGGSFVMDHAVWPDRFSTQRHRVIELPRPPLVSVLAVSYYDLDNTVQTMDPTAYMVIGTGANMPAQLQPLNNAWPDTYLREDAVQITYQAGYVAAASPTDPDDASAVPESIKAAIKLCVERDFSTTSKEQQDQLNCSIETKLARYKVFTL